MKRHDKGLACHGHAAMGNRPWTGMTVTLSYYLGIEVQQSTAGITICQSAYTKKLLDSTELADSNPTRTPMEAQLQLRKAGTTTAVDATNYHSIVGSLRYLVNTSPDLAYSVGYVSRFIEKPREEHLV